MGRLIFESICEDFYQAVVGGECSSELVNTGFETIAVYIFESTKKVLDEFERGGEEDESAIEILNSDELKKIGKIFV